MKPAEPITLRADGAGLTVAPAVGGAVTRYRLERDGTTWEWLRPTPPEALSDGMPYQTAAFPLVPYSNRIRDGRFAFRGRAVRLPLNRPPERHAIHGHGWQSAWRAIAVGPADAQLEYRHAASAWPWPYRATQRFTLTASSCDIGSWGVPRPRLEGWVTGMGPRTGRPLPEAMVLKETRSNSQIPTPFPHRFPLNSHALTSVDGLLGHDEIDAAIQTTSTSKARRVDFGDCGPPQPATTRG